MKNWFLWLLAGGVSFVGGVLALFNPISASIAATTFAGCALLIVGALQGYSAWTTSGIRATTGAGLMSGSALLLGIILLLGPFGNGGLMRIVLTLLLVVSGVAIIWSARQLRGDNLFVAALTSGVVPIVLGGVVLSGFPAVIADNLGVTLGVELLALGVALIVFSIRHKKMRIVQS
jgi:uncharacterized membrane protein HdeD (DUF308 family)